MGNESRRAFHRRARDLQEEICHGCISLYRLPPIFGVICRRSVINLPSRKPPTWCGQCHNATLEEKFSAWEEIAKTMSDCPIPRRPGMADDVPSVHQFLRDYMDLEKKPVGKFYTGRKLRLWGGLFSSCPTRSGERKGVWSGKRYSVPKTIQAVSPIVVKNSPRKLERCGFGSRHWDRKQLPQGQSDFDRQTGTPLFGCVSLPAIWTMYSPGPVVDPSHAVPPGGHCMGPQRKARISPL